MDAILDDRREKANYKSNWNNIIDMLYRSSLREGEYDIGNNISIEVTNCYFGYENEHFEGTSYCVKEDDELVFWGTKKSGGRNELHKYTPGYWEEEVKEYVGYANCNEE